MAKGDCEPAVEADGTWLRLAGSRSVPIMSARLDLFGLAGCCWLVRLLWLFVVTTQKSWSLFELAELLLSGRHWPLKLVVPGRASWLAGTKSLAAALLDVWSPLDNLTGCSGSLVSITGKLSTRMGVVERGGRAVVDLVSSMVAVGRVAAVVVLLEFARNSSTRRMFCEFELDCLELLLLLLAFFSFCCFGLLGCLTDVVESAPLVEFDLWLDELFFSFFGSDWPRLLAGLACC